MNNLETSMRVEAIVKDMLNNFMVQNQVQPSDMVAALNSALVSYYPLVNQELLRSFDEAKLEEQQKAAVANTAKEVKPQPKQKEAK